MTRQRTREKVHRHAVVMAGGAGERFWPRSRRARPKPLLRVLGRATLLDAALARARRFAGRDRVWIVCTRENAAALRAASGLPAGRILVEPEPRDTAAVVAFAAAAIARHDPQAVLLFLAADHVIPDARALAAALDRAARAAADAGALVTFGIAPTAPETGYGYLEVGAPADRAHPGLHRVTRFCEKPPLARARRFVASGRHLWNAGIFVWRADRILEELARHAPALDRAFAAWRRRPSAAALVRAYRRAPKLPIDKAVLERSDRVWTLPLRLRWSDVGSWASLANELGVRPGHSRVVEDGPCEGAARLRLATREAGSSAPRGAARSISGDVLLIDAGGNLVWPSGRQVVLLGVEGLAVIETDDALLVASLDRSGDLRRVVDELRKRGRLDLL